MFIRHRPGRADKPEYPRAVDFLDSLLSRLGRPVGRFNTELLGVPRVQSLPAAEFHGIGADDASNGLTVEKPIHNVEADVPACSTRCDEAVTNVGPQRQARAHHPRLRVPTAYRSCSACTQAALERPLASQWFR